MSRKQKSHHFKKKETGFHKFAVMQLAEWINGEIEKPFYIDGQIAFVLDVVKDNRLYEVVHSHPLDGHKLGLMQYWSYRNKTDLTVFEVDADYILSQTQRPEFIESFNCYVIEL
jgi:hypothetical protein